MYIKVHVTKHIEARNSVPEMVVFCSIFFVFAQPTIARTQTL